MSKRSDRLSWERIMEVFEQAAAGPVTVDITTTGRTTGRPRRIEIWIVNIDGRIVIGGTPAPRDWLANLRESPALTVHLKGDPSQGAAREVVADVSATAVEVTDRAIRVAIWNHTATRWYRDQTSVDDLVANAPTVELALEL